VGSIITYGSLPKTRVGFRVRRLLTTRSSNIFFKVIMRRERDLNRLLRAIHAIGKSLNLSGRIKIIR